MNTNELDQIIRFHFTESIFDIILLCSIKLLILFILISELETTCLRSANKIARETLKELENQNENDSIINQDDNHEDDQELILNRAKLNNSIEKKMLHYLVFFICLSSMIYSCVKFSIVLKIIIESNTTKSNLHMDYFFFALLCTEFGFSLIELFVSLFSWKFMRDFHSNILKQMISKQTRSELEQNENKKVDLKRLLKTARSELSILVGATLFMTISSVTNIIVPYFFGAVVDAATKYTDLNQMNLYVIYMFIILLIGSIASGFRSWLFGLAGQNVVAKLRKQVFTAIIKHDISFFDSNRTGELTSRLSSDTQVLQNAVSDNISNLGRYAIQIVGSLVLMFSLEPSLTGLLLLIIPPGIKILLINFIFLKFIIILIMFKLYYVLCSMVNI